MHTININIYSIVINNLFRKINEMIFKFVRLFSFYSIWEINTVLIINRILFLTKALDTEIATTHD